MSEEPERPGTGPTAESKLERLKELSLKKTEAVITLRKRLTAETTLSDEEIEVAEIEVTIPSSALLGSVEIKRRPSAAIADNPSFDLDVGSGSDPIHADGDIGPIADADGVDLVHSLPE